MAVSQPEHVRLSPSFAIKRQWSQRKHQHVAETCRVALITGGNSGIGLATAKRLVGEGAYAFITGRRQNKLDAGVKEIGANVTGVQWLAEERSRAAPLMR